MARKSCTGRWQSSIFFRRSGWVSAWERARVESGRVGEWESESVAAPAWERERVTEWQRELRSHALTLPLSHSALPRPCFRVLETKSHRFRFGSSVGFNAMIVVLLIGGQQAREAASTFGEFAHL